MSHYEPKPSYGLLVVACPPDDAHTYSHFLTTSSWSRLLALMSQWSLRIRWQHPYP